MTRIPIRPTAAFLLLLFCLFWLSSCRSSRVTYTHKPPRTTGTTVWTQNRWQIADYFMVYKNNNHVEQTLKRAQPYLPYILEIFRLNDLPSELAYLPMLESSFSVDAISKTGAKGLWQFKKATALDNGLKVGWKVDDRLNWRRATKAAAKYLNKLGKRFNYDWELALASYNGGPTYISKSMKRQQTNNFWQLKIRKEPLTYVPRFLAMLQVAKHKYPELYYVGNNRQ